MAKFFQKWRNNFDGFSPLGEGGRNEKKNPAQTPLAKLQKSKKFSANP